MGQSPRRLEQGKALFFSNFSYGRARHIAARFAWVLLLAARQEVAKKRARTFPPGPPFFAALQRERREDTYTLPVLCLNLSHHERQAG